MIRIRHSSHIFILPVKKCPGCLCINPCQTCRLRNACTKLRRCRGYFCNIFSKAKASYSLGEGRRHQEREELLHKQGGSAAFALCFCGVIHSADAAGRVLFMSRSISVPRHRRESEAAVTPNVGGSRDGGGRQEKIGRGGGQRRRRRDGEKESKALQRLHLVFIL